MSKKYEFDPLDDGSYVMAKPKNGNKNPVRINTKWIESDDVEAGWERPIGALIKSDLLSDMDLKDGNGRISRRQAVETLREATDDEGPIVTSEEHAEALIAYLGEKEIVNIEDDGSVLILQDPQTTENDNMWINWAAGIDACVEKIDETEERIKSAKNKLEDRLEDMEEDTDSIEEKARETAQELKSIGDGPGLPQNPEELPSDERAEYQRLKKKLVYHNKMKDVVDEDVTKTVKDGTQKLADNLEMLNSAKQALKEKREGFRLVALQNEQVPEGAQNIVDNMGDLATALVGIGDVDEAVENTGTEELEGMVEDLTGTVDGVTDKAVQTSSEETEQTSKGPSMSD